MYLEHLKPTHPMLKKHSESDREPDEDQAENDAEVGDRLCSVGEGAKKKRVARDPSDVKYDLAPVDDHIHCAKLTDGARGVSRGVDQRESKAVDAHVSRHSVARREIDGGLASEEQNVEQIQNVLGAGGWCAKVYK
jgi:hypothetical protein